MTVPTGGRRILAIDAARGFAMLAVCVSHIGDVIASHHGALGRLLLALGMVATPAFLLLSGISAGYVIRPNADSRSRIKLVDRGLFLLVVAHALLAAAHLGESSSTSLYASLYITDAVAVALFVAALIHGWAPWQLLAAGGALVMGGWILPWVWDAESGALLSSVNRVVFYGARPGDFALGYTVPIGTYVGVFLIGMSFSRGNRELLQGLDLPAVRRIGLAMLAVIVILTGVKLATVLIKPGLDPGTYEIVRRIVDPRQKLPPGVAYLLMYGAAALLALMCLLWFDAQGRARILREALATIGRASLMVYLLQEALIFSGSRYLGIRHIGSVAFWAGYLAVIVVLIWVAARSWGRIDGNRFLTVGLKRAYDATTSARREGSATSGSSKAG